MTAVYVEWIWGAGAVAALYLIFRALGRFVIREYFRAKHEYLRRIVLLRDDEREK